MKGFVLVGLCAGLGGGGGGAPGPVTARVGADTGAGVRTGEVSTRGSSDEETSLELRRESVGVCKAGSNCVLGSPSSGWARRAR